MSEPPTNIQEFNKICAFVFARLYQTFPKLVDIDRTGIAGVLGITDAGALDPALTWLARNDYIKITDLNNPWRQITLADKGLAARGELAAFLRSELLGGLGMSDDPFEKWREARKEYFGDSTYMDRKKRFHEWMVSMWKAGHMPEEIRDIWVHDYIGEPQDEGDEPPA